MISAQDYLNKYIKHYPDAVFEEHSKSNTVYSEWIFEDKKQSALWHKPTHIMVEFNGKALTLSLRDGRAYFCHLSNEVGNKL